ncbi:hypothetical protein AGMMS50256_19850 [Betaproteobacteria bacterium]|nr:hypothetical protein AGMMS50256_19850 [Betaproteobacteria bacterium]
MPRFSGWLALCTVALTAWASFLLYQAQSLDSEVENARAAMRQNAEQAPLPGARGQNFAATRDLIDAIGNAQAAIDPYAFLLDLRAVATANEVHILRVRMESRSITVEGRVDQRGGRDDALSAFLVGLRRLGFTPEAVASSAPTPGNGFFAYRFTPGAAQKGASAAISQRQAFRPVDLTCFGRGLHPSQNGRRNPGLQAGVWAPTALKGGVSKRS